MIKSGCICQCRFSINGEVNQYIIKSEKSSTCIIIGNESFQVIEKYLKENDLEAKYKIECLIMREGN